MKKIIYLFSLIVLVAACNDDFMNRQPKTEIGVERFFNTEEDLKMYTYRLYNFTARIPPTAVPTIKPQRREQLKLKI